MIELTYITSSVVFQYENMLTFKKKYKKCILLFS